MSWNRRWGMDRSGWIELAHVLKTALGGNSVEKDSEDLSIGGREEFVLSVWRRRGTTCVSNHHLCLRVWGHQQVAEGGPGPKVKNQEVGLPEGSSSKRPKGEGPGLGTLPLLTSWFCLSLSLCPSVLPKVSVASIMAFQSLEFRVKQDIWRGRKKRKRGKKEWSMTFQTGFQERRKGLLFVFEASRRLGHNYIRGEFMLLLLLHVLLCSVLPQEQVSSWVWMNHRSPQSNGCGRASKMHNSELTNL